LERYNVNNAAQGAKKFDPHKKINAMQCRRMKASSKWTHSVFVHLGSFVHQLEVELNF